MTSYSVYQTSDGGFLNPLDVSVEASNSKKAAKKAKKLTNSSRNIVVFPNSYKSVYGYNSL